MKLTMVVKAFLFAVAACSAARADIMYSFTDAYGGSFTYKTPNYVPNTAFWVATSVPAADLSACTPDTGTLACEFANFFPSGSPDSVGNAWPEIDFVNSTSTGTVASATFFPGVSFSSNGSYVGQAGGSLSITGTPAAAAVPEPSSVMLLLTMLLAVALVARKRIAQGL